MAAFRTEVAGKKTNEINYHEFKEKSEQKTNALKKDCGSNAMALRIWLAQQQLRTLAAGRATTVCFFFYDFFFDVDHFLKVFIEFVTILLLFLCFGFLATRDVGF